jgi:hypothetical protein
VSNGKGSTPRPLSVDAGTFAANWDRVFGSAGDTGGAALPEGSTPADSRRPHSDWAHTWSCVERNCVTCRAIYDRAQAALVMRCRGVCG